MRPSGAVPHHAAAQVVQAQRDAQHAADDKLKEYAQDRPPHSQDVAGQR